MTHSSQCIMLFNLTFREYTVVGAIAKNKVIYWKSESIFVLCRYKAFYQFNRNHHAIKGRHLFPENGRFDSEILNMPFLSHSFTMKIVKRGRTPGASLLSELFQFGFYVKEIGLDLIVCSRSDPYAQRFSAWLSNYNLKLYEGPPFPNILSRSQPSPRQPINLTFFENPPVVPVPEFILPKDPPEVAISHQRCSLAAAQLEKLVFYQDHPPMVPLDLRTPKRVSSSSLLWQLLTIPQNGTK